jgi:hypothetical protein
MLGLTVWVGVGIVYSVIGWGVTGLVIRLTGMGPWGWLALVVTLIASLLTVIVGAIGYFWYLHIIGDSWRYLVRHAREHPGRVAIAVLMFVLIVASYVAASVLWLRWVSAWRWLVLGVLSSMLVSYGFSSTYEEAKYGRRQ